jgi:hypothetical protein
MSRSLYLILPDWHGEPDELHEAVVETLPHGPRYIQVALELWRLVDREDQALKIEGLLEQAYERPQRDLDRQALGELEGLLDGLDDALKQTWLDSKGQVLQERLPEVRRRTHLLDLEDAQGHLACEGVSEGLSQVHILRDFLKQALNRSLHLALD